MVRNRSSWLDRIPSLSDEPTHPAQIALRTYALAVSLSLGPSLIPFITALIVPKARSKNLPDLGRILRRDLGHDGFAFTVTLAVAGGAALKRSWPLWRVVYDRQDKDEDVHRSSGDQQPESLGRLVQQLFRRVTKYLAALTPEQETFISNVLSSSIGILLLQVGRQRTARLKRVAAAARGKPLPRDLTSPTLDLTLLLLVRAIDSIVQSFILHKTTPVPGLKKDRKHLAVESQLHAKLQREKIKLENKSWQSMTSKVDAFVFWACSARIMWCFFYEPHRLPRSYVKWINTLANLDGRIIETLQLIRTRQWSYKTGSAHHATVLQSGATDLGLPASWGDPHALPAYGGAIANEAWKKLGVTSRPGVAGIPCEVIHGQVGSSLGLRESCTANASLRMAKGFFEATAIYLPVHFLPVLLTRPQTLLRPHRLFETLFGSLRSAAFLSSFIGFYWYTVCLTRTLVLAKLFPFVSHDFWDSPYGCIMAGCLACGSSIWIENGRRRGEMALYVLPRAIRTCLPDALVKSGNRAIRLAERLVFILSISSLLTAAAHRPDSLRGLSRWTLAFVTNGPNAGFWKRRRRDPSVPPTPSFPPTPSIVIDSGKDDN
ncbi:unnamed protein product [Cyclocybe aegerita]|uniref:Integral membrane protein n=1 Tax=Cyclocybe aegerita TaxID=1973307 RepID=A0A8S0W0W4_CYCAE|nr:unnamed protein product [Cyclocybe aegerita]